MCFEDKTTMLATIIKQHVPQDIDKSVAKTMIKEHTGPARGRQSRVAVLADELYGRRRRIGVDSTLGAIDGSTNQKSALREAIMIVLRERAGLVPA